MFNLLQNKALFISQIKNSNIGVRQIDEGGLDEQNGMNFSEYVALLSGNKELLEKAKIEKQITSLESERNTFILDAYKQTEKFGRLESELPKSKATLLALQEDLKLAQPYL